MKYTAKPVTVEAFRITHVTRHGHETDFSLALENGDIVKATPEMTARMEPKVGDFWVKQEDGYIYLNPRDVFMRKYAPAK
jgi:hypothetical protein